MKLEDMLRRGNENFQRKQERKLEREKKRRERESLEAAKTKWTSNKHLVEKLLKEQQELEQQFKGKDHTQDIVFDDSKGSLSELESRTSRITMIGWKRRNHPSASATIARQRGCRRHSADGGMVCFPDVRRTVRKHKPRLSMLLRRFERNFQTLGRDSSLVLLKGD